MKNPESNTVLCLAVPLHQYRNNSGDILFLTWGVKTVSKWDLIIFSAQDKKSPHLSSEPPKAVFIPMLAQKVGHENSSSTKLTALDPKPWVLHSNWSCVLPVCLGEEGEGHPVRDTVHVSFAAKGKSDAITMSRHSAQEKELLCRENLNGVQDSQQKQPTVGDR